jgi:acyl-CoA dehydrogenase
LCSTHARYAFVRNPWTSAVIGYVASVADFIIFMVVTEPDAPAHLRCSMIVVDKDTPGVTILRDIPSMHEPVVEFGRFGNHSEILLEDVRVPKSHLIGPRGHGFVLSQVRLGPGRLHHATRWLGEAERAFDLMCARARWRRRRMRLAETDAVTRPVR